MEYEPHIKEYPVDKYHRPTHPKLWWPPGDGSPFDPPSSGTPSSSPSANVSAAQKGVTTKSTLHRADKKGYCECCVVNFKRLDKHLVSLQHRTFATNAENYASLDALMEIVKEENSREAQFLKETLQLDLLEKDEGKRATAELKASKEQEEDEKGDKTELVEGLEGTRTARGKNKSKSVAVPSMIPPLAAGSPRHRSPAVPVANNGGVVKENSGNKKITAAAEKSEKKKSTARARKDARMGSHFAPLAAKREEKRGRTRDEPARVSARLQSAGVALFSAEFPLFPDSPKKKTSVAKQSQMKKLAPEEAAAVKFEKKGISRSRSRKNNNCPRSNKRLVRASSGTSTKKLLEEKPSPSRITARRGKNISEKRRCMLSDSSAAAATTKKESKKTPLKSKTKVNARAVVEKMSEHEEAAITDGPQRKKRKRSKDNLAICTGSLQTLVFFLFRSHIDCFFSFLFSQIILTSIVLTCFAFLIQ